MFPTTNTKWRKRKSDNTTTTATTTNLKRHKPPQIEQDEDDDEDQQDQDLDDPSIAPADADEDQDLHPIIPHSTTPTTNNNVPPASDAAHYARESEVLSGGRAGTRISDFPLVVAHAVNRPHSSVLAIVAAERAILLPSSSENRSQNPNFLENVSHGQLQALSAVPADSPSFADHDRPEGSSSSSSSYVCTPPAIMEGRGVVKRYGNRLHVVPMHADWFSPNSVYRLERQVVPHFFTGKSSELTPEKYMDCRNWIVAKYIDNPEKRLSVTDCQGLVMGVDIHDLNRIVRFLDHWGIINYSVSAPNQEARSNGPYLREDPNGELHIPSAALRSIYSLIQFDKPRSRFRAEDISMSLLRPGEEVSDLDSRIRERLSENRCNYCSRPLPRVHYQSLKEADVMLCSDCFYDGRFVVGHSSIDFIRMDPAKDFSDLDGDSWTDQETLLLLEALEMYNDNWNDIAEHVGTKSKAQCILHFIRLPMEDGLLENIEVPGRSISSYMPNKEDCAKSYSSSNGDSAGNCPNDLESEGRLPFSNSPNPVMSLVAFLASAVGPRVAAACAHASLESFSKEDPQSGASNTILQRENSTHGDRMNMDNMRGREGGPHGSITNSGHKKEENLATHEAFAAPLPAESVKNAAKAGLSAAAMKAKLFADHEEREIQRMSASIINHQLKRLELKLKQFAEVETMLLKECEQVERTRQRLAAERTRIMSTGFVTSRVNTAPNIPLAGPGVSVAAAAALASNAVSNRQPVMSVSAMQANMAGYGNNQPTHPRMSLMARQPMYPFGPRLPLSAIHPPSSSASSANAMFNAAPNNSNPNLGHPMLRPVSGTNTNVG